MAKWLIKYLSTFSGIGGFELGIQLAYVDSIKRSEERGIKEDTKGNEGQGFQSTEGEDTGIAEGQSRSDDWNIAYKGQPTCVGYSEIDKYATEIYKKHFPTHKNYGDITKIIAEELPDFDLLVGGFPCQAFSIAGKRRGFEDTRGTMFFELARILRTKQPRLFVFENVKGLLSHDNGNTFRTIIATLTELGYDCQWQVLNSKNHGVPQNRERVFIIGNRRGTQRPSVFPMNMVQCEYEKTTIDEKVYLLSADVSSYARELLLGMAQHKKEKLSRQQMQDLFTKIEQGLQTKECGEVERESSEIRQQSEGDLQEVETLEAFLGGEDDTGAVCGVVSIPTEEMLLLWNDGGNAFHDSRPIQQQDAQDDDRQDRFIQTLRTWELGSLLFAVQPYQGRLFYSIGDGKDWVNVYQTKVEIICKENTLSCILEEHPDQKYFLSDKMVERIMNYRDTSQTLLPLGTKARKQQARTLVKVNSMHKK